MPKIVDHRERRAAIARAACETIAGAGLEGTTLARVGREVGLTTGAIQHYFRDKDGLLAAALRYAYDDQLERMRARAAQTPYSLLDVLAEALPLSARSRRTMRVWLAFWGRAVGDPDIARTQRKIHDEWALRVREELEQAAARGVLAADVDAAQETEGLIAQIRGICIRALLDPGAWRPERQLELLQRYLDRLAVSVGDRRASAWTGARTSSS